MTHAHEASARPGWNGSRSGVGLPLPWTWPAKWGGRRSRGNGVIGFRQLDDHMELPTASRTVVSRSRRASARPELPQSRRKAHQRSRRPYDSPENANSRVGQIIRRRGGPPTARNCTVASAAHQPQQAALRPGTHRRVGPAIRRSRRPIRTPGTARRVGTSSITRSASSPVGSAAAGSGWLPVPDRRMAGDAGRLVRARANTTGAAWRARKVLSVAQRRRRVLQAPAPAAESRRIQWGSRTGRRVLSYAMRWPEGSPAVIAATTSLS